jgi:ABC-2 type transport system permease protein
MMLWYKAWWETRTRFLIGLATLAALCLIAVAFESIIRARIGATTAPLNTYAGYIHRVIYSSGARPLFQFFVLVLGLGGLRAEHEQRTAGFTLALPVRRWQIVAIRAAVGLCELIALALLPAVSIPALSPLMHQGYPFVQAVQFSLLWIAAYSLLFAMAYLLSALLSGPYTALLVAWVLFLAHAMIASVPRLRPFRLNLQWLTSGLGMPYFDAQTALLVGPLPWTRLLFIGTLTLLLVAVTAAVTEQQDF